MKILKWLAAGIALNPLGGLLNLVATSANGGIMPNPTSVNPHLYFLGDCIKGWRVVTPLSGAIMRETAYLSVGDLFIFASWLSAFLLACYVIGWLIARFNFKKLVRRITYSIIAILFVAMAIPSNSVFALTTPSGSFTTININTTSITAYVSVTDDGGEACEVGMFTSGGSDSHSGLRTGQGAMLTIDGLTPLTTYSLTYTVQNSYNAFWNTVSFTTANPYHVPAINIAAASNVTDITARLNAFLADDGYASCQTRWGYGTASQTAANFASYTNVTSYSGSWVTGDYPYLDISGLNPNTTYYYRVQAKNSSGTTTSSEFSFTTTFTPPNIAPAPASSITDTTATLNGVINTGANLQVRWGYGITSQTAANFASYTNVSAWGGSYSAPATPSDAITGLTTNTLYYYRFQVKDGGGNITTSAEISFYTTGVPTVSLSAVTLLTNTTVTLNCLINSDGGYPAGVGIEWAWGTTSQTAANFASYNVHVDGAYAGAYSTNSTPSTNVAALTANTTYYYRCRVQNTAGVTVSAEGTFTTLDVPVATSVAASNIAYTTAKLNGTITFDGNAFCQIRWGYGTTSKAVGAFATYDHVTTLDGAYITGNNVFLNVTGLTQGTTYYFRFQATNSIGTSTSGELSFTTSINVGTPSNIQASPQSTSVTLTWAKGSGSSESVIIYNTNAYPTTINDGTLAYRGSASTYKVSGLLAGTTYYFSVWGVSGTTYSASYISVVMTTNAGIPTANSGVTLGTPWRWAAAPNYQNLQNWTLVYPAINGVADGLGMPRATLWFLMAMAMAAVGGSLAYIGAGQNGRGRGSQAIGGVIGGGIIIFWWLVQIVPWYFMLAYILLFFGATRTSREME